jgi:hypothetical protein
LVRAISEHWLHRIAIEGYTVDVHRLAPEGDVATASIRSMRSSKNGREIADDRFGTAPVTIAIPAARKIGQGVPARLHFGISVIAIRRGRLDSFATSLDFRFRVMVSCVEEAAKRNRLQSDARCVRITI